MCRRHGISDARLKRFRAEYGGLEVSEAQRLKRLLTDAILDNATLKDRGKLVTPAANRRAVHLIREKMNLSERRACDIVGVARRVIQYKPVRPDDGALRQRLRELATDRRRLGYRRLVYLLAREGLAPNHKKLLRIYHEEGLKVVPRPQHCHQRDAAEHGHRQPLVAPGRPDRNEARRTAGETRHGRCGVKPHSHQCERSGHGHGKARHLAPM